MGKTNHSTVEVGLVALRSVCHEGKLGYTQDFSLHVFDAGLPHITGGIGEDLQI
jgi:hypothetical protein